MVFLNTNFIYLFILQLLPSSSILFFFTNRSLNFLELLSINCFISSEYIKFYFIHFRLSFFFFFTQSVEFLAWTTVTIQHSVLLYIYYNLINHKYFKIYTLYTYLKNFQISLDNLYYNFWWLEREVSEMHGIIFLFKFDTRNLLLEYFSIFKPLKKQFPSFGLVEIYFNLIYWFSIHPVISLQS
jgi:NADH:ubiquinone oxidoreductase subunit C